MSNLSQARLFVISTALALLTLVVLVGCALDPMPTPTPLPTPTPPPTPTPLPRGGNLTIRLASDVPDLRPWQPRSRGEEHIIALLYNGLVRLDPQLRPQPDLAERWDASADGLLITFTLRPDVAWHDGTPLTAEDVEYTLTALRELSPTTALLADLQRINSIDAVTTDTLQIGLTERYAPIFSRLAVPVLPRHLLIGRDIAGLNFWEEPVGSGPFRFTERDPGISITFEANPIYYRGQPLLDRVAFVVAPEPDVAVEALADGQLLLGELPWDTATEYQQELADLQSGLYAENGYYFLGFNTREGRPFADVRVRQALAAAVDLPALVEEVTGGQGIPIANSAAPGSWADFVAPITDSVDLDRARTLLDEAGWKLPEDGEVRERDGQLLEAVIFVRGDDPRRVEAAEWIAEAGTTIGMRLTVQPADFETVIRSKYAPPYDFDLLLGSWINGAGDPDVGDYAYYDPDDFALFHSSQVNQGTADTRPVLNIIGFSDPAYDNQAAAAHQLYDLEARAEALRLAQQRVADQLPYLFLWADRIPVFLSDQVTTLDGPVDLNTPVYLWNIERWHLAR